MKYVIECPYCGTTYSVDAERNEATFMCKSCGGQNSTTHAVEKRDDIPEEFRAEVRERVRETQLKQELDEEFDRKQETVDEAYYYDRLEKHNQTQKHKGVIIFIIVVIIFILLIAISPESSKEEDVLFGMNGATCKTENLEKAFG